MIKNETKKISSKISVALCTRNGAAYINEQLESLAKQTQLPAELIVTDDLSEDDTVASIRAFQKNAPFPITLYSNEPRLGVVKNYERALRFCSGELIAFCDQDDKWYENKLQLLSDSLLGKLEGDTSIPSLIHSNVNLLFSDDSTQIPTSRYKNGILPPAAKILRTLVLQNTVVGSTVLITRALRDISLPIPDNAIMHDWWFAIQAIAYGKLFYIDQPTIFYRRHENTVTTSYRKSSLSRKIKDHIHDVRLLLRCAAGEQLFLSELNQAMYFLEEKTVSSPIKEEVKELISDIAGNGLGAAMRYVNNADIYYSRPILKLVAALSLYKYLGNNQTTYKTIRQ